MRNRRLGRRGRRRPCRRRRFDGAGLRGRRRLALASRERQRQDDSKRRRYQTRPRARRNYPQTDDYRAIIPHFFISLRLCAFAPLRQILPRPRRHHPQTDDHRAAIPHFFALFAPLRQILPRELHPRRAVAAALSRLGAEAAHAAMVAQMLAHDAPQDARAATVNHPKARYAVPRGVV